MANTLNVNSLPEYIEQHKDELFVKSVVGAKTLDYIEIMPGVKHKEALNYLDSTVELAEGGCGWNPAGSDTFSQRTVEVKPLSVQKEYCWLDFKNYWMNYQLLFEAGRQTLPFEEKIAESNMNAIKEALEKAVWQGNTVIEGLLAQIDAESDTVKVSFSDGQTATSKVDAVVNAIPTKALAKGVRLFMSYSDFRSYVAEQNANCCSNRSIIDAANEELKYVGDSRITIIPVLGLEGTNKMVATPADGLVYATDIEGSDSVYEMRYDAKERKFDLDVLFNCGTAVKMVDEVVIGK